MEIKYDEFIKRLTVSVRLSMTDDLSDWLDITDIELRDDIDKYLAINDDNVTKADFELKIEEGLSDLMIMYSNEWKVNCSNCDESGEEECSDCEGTGEKNNEGECDTCDGEGVLECNVCNGSGQLTLANAMDNWKIPQFKQSWDLTELNDEWTDDKYILSNELDEISLDSYYEMIDA